MSLLNKWKCTTRSHGGDGNYSNVRGLAGRRREGNAAPAGLRHLTVVFSFSLAALFSEKVRNMSPDEIRIPPEPPGRCSSKLQVGTSPLAF